MFKTETVQFCSKLLQEEYTLPFQICPNHWTKIYYILLGNAYKYLLSSGVVRLELKGLNVRSSCSLPAITLLLHDFQDVSEPDSNLAIQNPLPSPKAQQAPNGKHAVIKLSSPSLAQNIYSGMRVPSAKPDSAKAYFESACCWGRSHAQKWTCSKGAPSWLSPNHHYCSEPWAQTASLPLPCQPGTLSPSLPVVHIFATPIRSEKSLLFAIAGWLQENDLCLLYTPMHIDYFKRCRKYHRIYCTHPSVLFLSAKYIQQR